MLGLSSTVLVSHPSKLEDLSTYGSQCGVERVNFEGTASSMVGVGLFGFLL